jgi:chromatin segregation and condensation protein Rec8/ScpA/Scc1 (kleisin family)
METTRMTDNPLKWLLAQLPDYLTPEQLNHLMAAYEANKARYYLDVKIRDAERRIRIYERWPNDNDPTRLARWRAKLARLKEQA